MKKTGKLKEETTFEMAMERLENAVVKLDKGSLTLDEALAAFEDGVRWSKECHRFLEQAEERIQIILKNEEGGYATTPFDKGKNK